MSGSLSYGARVAKFFRGGASPRRGDPDRRKQKGGRWDASRSPPLDDTVHCGRSRGYSPSSCDSISLDSSGRSEVAYKAPSRVRFDQ